MAMKYIPNPWEPGEFEVPEERLIPDGPDKVRVGEFVFLTKFVFSTREEAKASGGELHKPRQRHRQWGFNMLRPGETLELAAEDRRAALNAARVYKHQMKRAGKVWDYALIRHPYGRRVLIRTA